MECRVIRYQKDLAKVGLSLTVRNFRIEVDGSVVKQFPETSEIRAI